MSKAVEATTRISSSPCSTAANAGKIMLAEAAGIKDPADSMPTIAHLRAGLHDRGSLPLGSGVCSMSVILIGGMFGWAIGSDFSFRGSSAAGKGGSIDELAEDCWAAGEGVADAIAASVAWSVRLLSMSGFVMYAVELQDVASLE